MKPPAGAIVTKEALENVIILGLPIYMWHVDDGLITEKTPIRLVPSEYGIHIHFDMGTWYLKDVGIPDNSATKIRPVWNYKNWMFNTREEAVQAMNENDRACEELFIIKEKDRT
jgi:hypothetical protein